MLNYFKRLGLNRAKKISLARDKITKNFVNFDIYLPDKLYAIYRVLNLLQSNSYLKRVLIKL